MDNYKIICEGVMYTKDALDLECPVCKEKVVLETHGDRSYSYDTEFSYHVGCPKCDIWTRICFDEETGKSRWRRFIKRFEKFNTK